MVVVVAEVGEISDGYYQDELFNLNGK